MSNTEAKINMYQKLCLERLALEFKRFLNSGVIPNLLIPSGEVLILGLHVLLARLRACKEESDSRVPGNEREVSDSGLVTNEILFLGEYFV